MPAFDSHLNAEARTEVIFYGCAYTVANIAYIIKRIRHALVRKRLLSVDITFPMLVKLIAYHGVEPCIHV